MVISCAELLTYLILAALAGDSWDERVVLYVSDNMNTVSWLNKRYSQVPVIQLLLRLLGIWEARHQVSSQGTYVRTYHNVTGDGLTREDWREVAQDLELRGYVRHDPTEAWRHFLRFLTEGPEGCWGVLEQFRASETERRLVWQLARSRCGWD